MNEAVDREYPGYEIRWTTGPSVSIQKREPPIKNAIASIYQDGSRADIFVSDLTKLPTPPLIELSVNSSGLEKLTEALKTGKAQTLQSGEFSFHTSSLPLTPDADTIDGATLEIGSNVSRSPEQDVRLEVDTPDGVLRIAIMKLKPVRAGIEEIELQLAHTAQPFQIRFIIGASTTGEPHDANLSTFFQHHSFSRISQSLDFIFALFAGGELRIYDLTSDRLIVRAKLSGDTDLLPSGLRLLIDMVASIESYFKVSIPWPSTIPDEEVEKVRTLDCLISGDEYGTNLSFTAMCPKTPSLSAQAESWRIAPSVLFFESLDPAKITPLFGVDLSVPAWGLYTEQALPVDIEKTIKEIQEASEGSIVPIPFRGLSPTYIRFK